MPAPATEASLLSSYQPLPGTFDEMFSRGGAPRPELSQALDFLRGVEPEKVVNADEPGRAHSLLLWHAPLKVAPRRVAKP